MRYGIRAPGDPLIEDSLRVVDACLKVDLPQGPCWRRYNNDGYGQQADGRAWHGYGVGRPWPLLTGERGHYELAAGRDVRPYVKAIEEFSSATGLLPEQVWDYADIPSLDLYCGRSAGSAQPLCWAHAEYLKLLHSTVNGRIFDRISIVEERSPSPRSNSTFQSRMEIFRTTRPISAMVCGGTLRIVDPEPFTVVWSPDNWATTNKTDAVPVDNFGAFADITAAPGRDRRHHLHPLLARV